MGLADGYTAEQEMEALTTYLQSTQVNGFNRLMVCLN